MILSKEMEDGFLGYDVSTRREVEHYRTEMYDDVFVHWEKKNMFGKIKRQSTEFSFKRLRLSDSKKDTFKMVGSCEKFIDRMSSLFKEKNKVDNKTIEELRKEFSGNDDFSLGVQHAISILEEKGLI